MPSDRLYELLAEAKARPSKAYRASKLALDVPQQTLEGVLSGSDIVEKLRQRKMSNQTLQEALGGNVPDRVRGYAGLPVSTIKNLGGLGDIAKLTEQSTVDNRRELFDLKEKGITDRFNRSENRKKENFDKLFGMKPGNKDAVNQAKNAVQGLGYVDDLWSEIDRLTPAQKVLASNDLTGKMFPTINALKKNVRRTAGFSEGGKNLTANELEIVVDSFEPTMFDDQNSRKLKKKIASDFYSGTIDLYEAARLLGPAGAKLQAIAEQQRQKQGLRDSLIKNEVVGGGSDVDSIFGEEGL